MLRNLVAASTCDVLDGDCEIPHFKDTIGNRFDGPAAFHEDSTAATVHHHLGDARVDQEVFDRAQERQDAFQAAHSAPRSRWSK